ncbi:DUF1778 domain-containing protein [Deltaproteobacteria bacterium TL4]
MKPKTTRLNIRANTDQKKLLSQAAQIKNTTVSDFVLENACETAYEILAQKNHFVLSEEEWSTFCDALDAPPKDISGLKKLLMEPGVFDE